MPKVLVATTGQFALMTDGGFIDCDRPYIVESSQFLESRVLLGQAKVLRDSLPAKAKDAELAEFIAAHEGDFDVGLDNYLLSLDPEAAETRQKELAAEAAKAEAAAKGAKGAKGKAD